MPRHVKPMLGILSSFFEDKEYGYEYKWDGYRALAYWDGQQLRFESRNQLDITSKVRHLQVLSKSLKKTAILDGELVAITPYGKISFDLLQKKMGNKFPLQKTGQIQYILFDLLYWDHQWQIHKPLLERRLILDKIPLKDKLIQRSSLHTNEGRRLLDNAAFLKMEGIMAKQLTSPYYPGKRSDCWKKIKNVLKQEFVIGGWLTGKKSLAGQLGALMLGYHQTNQKKLIYAGNVGSGFSNQDRHILKKFLSEQEQNQNPFLETINKTNVKYVRPIFVAEIEFRAWTESGKIRQGTFKGIRHDKRASEVIMEIPSGRAP